MAKKGSVLKTGKRAADEAAEEPVEEPAEEPVPVHAEQTPEQKALAAALKRKTAPVFTALTLATHSNPTVVAVNVSSIPTAPEATPPGDKAASRLVVVDVSSAGYTTAPFVSGDGEKADAGAPKPLSEIEAEGDARRLRMWCYERHENAGCRGKRADDLSFVVQSGDILTAFIESSEIKKARGALVLAGAMNGAEDPESQTEEQKAKMARLQREAFLPDATLEIPPGTFLEIGLGSKNRDAAVGPRDAEGNAVPGKRGGYGCRVSRMRVCEGRSIYSYLPALQSVAKSFAAAVALHTQRAEDPALGRALMGSIASGDDVVFFTPVDAAAVLMDARAPATPAQDFDKDRFGDKVSHVLNDRPAADPEDMQLHVKQKAKELKELKPSTAAEWKFLRAETYYPLCGWTRDAADLALIRGHFAVVGDGDVPVDVSLMNMLRYTNAVGCLPNGLLKANTEVDGVWASTMLQIAAALGALDMMVVVSKYWKTKSGGSALRGVPVLRTERLLQAVSFDDVPAAGCDENGTFYRFDTGCVYSAEGEDGAAVWVTVWEEPRKADDSRRRDAPCSDLVVCRLGVNAAGYRMAFTTERGGEFTHVLKFLFRTDCPHAMTGAGGGAVRPTKRARFGLTE